MSRTTIPPSGIEIQTERVEEEPGQTRYAGALAWHGVWERFGMAEVLAESDIRYGQETDRANDLGFALSLGPLVNADSERRIAQRFGGEPSQDNLERDALLAELVEQPFAQRTLSRFVNQARYDWDVFNQVRVQRLQSFPGYAPTQKGVLILDDLPLPKPYAKAMDYLQPVWDNNQKRKVKGFSAVHLRYHHPQRPGYSLHLEVWRNTTACGETRSKGQARRRARPGEERSKLDIGLEAIEAWREIMAPVRTVVSDSWYTARWFISELRQQGLTFIGEADSQQMFEVDDDYLSVAEIREQLTPDLTQVKGMRKGVQAASVAAVIRPDRYTKERQAVRLVLVEGLHKPRQNDKGYHLVICSWPDWTDKRIVRIFADRPVIEQTHRQGKQHEGWLSFHNRTYQALQCHLAFSLLRTTLFALLARFAPQVATYSPAQIIDHWIGCVARLASTATGRLRIILPAHYPALALLASPAALPP